MNAAPQILVPPKTDCSEIATNLWMGAQPPVDRRMGQLFSVIVLCAKELQAAQPDLGYGARLLRVPLEDDSTKAPSHEDVKLAVAAGERVALLRRETPVLVTCHMGLNRSGLVTGIALIAGGRSAERAIDLIRRRRSSSALFNPQFVRVLHWYASRRAR